MYFTTLVRKNHFADKYLAALTRKGKLVSRTVDDHKTVFDQLGLPVQYATGGKVLSIY